MGRYIGIALSDDDVDICVDSDERLRSFPAVICKEKNQDSWLIGEAAYKSTLNGSGVIVDKLLPMLRKEGTATIDKKRYTASSLMLYFFRLLFSDVLNRVLEDDCFVIALRQLDPRICEKLRSILQSAGVSRDRLFLLSYTESFVYYILHQDKNLYNRMVGMFELSNQCLYYHEMIVSRGQRKYVISGSEPQEEAFSLDILKTASGVKIADQILRTLAERAMRNRSYSSVFLCGKGFEKTDFAKSFMSFILSRRRVCVEPKLFSIGAMLYARDLDADKVENEQYTVICDTRVSCDISIRVTSREREFYLPIVKAGDRWMEHRFEEDVILDKQNYIDFQVVRLVGDKRPVRLRMMLDGLPERENRLSRIRITAQFPDGQHMKVTATDLGFGDIVKKSDFSLSEEINIGQMESS